MREIKFRAWVATDWDESDNDRPCKYKMVEWNSNFFSDSSIVMGYSDEFPTEPDCYLMQYTGLKDNTRWDELTEVEQYQWVNAGNLPKHWDGRAIYEKDIVYYEICSRDDPVYGCYGDQLVVEFRDGSFKLCDGGREDLLSDYHDIVKVIGNIYENPELAEG
jgi:hypothetical protein